MLAACNLRGGRYRYMEDLLALDSRAPTTRYTLPLQPKTAIPSFVTNLGSPLFLSQNLPAAGL